MFLRMFVILSKKNLNGIIITEKHIRNVVYHTEYLQEGLIRL